MIYRAAHWVVVLAGLSLSVRLSAAQPVLLQIRPRIGDTLFVKLDQRVEMTGMPADCVNSSAEQRRNTRADSRPLLCSESTRQMTNVMEVFSRAIIRRSYGEGALVLAVTDSVRTSSSSGSVRPGPPARTQGRQNKSMELRLATDGGAEVVDADASEELRAVFGQMPAMLSRKPVSVGERWAREMRIPIAGEKGAMGLVKATFQLDSLGRRGDIAYITMRGTLSHDHRDGSDSELSGWLSGSVQLDRRVAWITETRAVIDVTSMVNPATGGKPMRVRTRVTQTLRARPVR